MAKKKESAEVWEPRLAFPVDDGVLGAEHIPKETSDLHDRVAWWYLAARNKLGLAIYYWQFRFLFKPKDRKVYDLNFLQHVEKDHEGKPEDWMERIHYSRAKNLYNGELQMVKVFDDIKWQKEHEKDVYLQKDPYIKAYKKKWLNNFSEDPEWKLVFHGIALADIGYVLDKLQEKARYRIKRLDAYINKVESKSKK